MGVTVQGVSWAHREPRPRGLDIAVSLDRTPEAIEITSSKVGVVAFRQG